MDIRKYVSGNFLTLDDLRDSEPRRERIGALVDGKFDKPNLVFESGDMISLNATNARVLMRAYGNETDNWRGREVVVYAGTAKYHGVEQPSVCVRVIEAAKAAGGDNAPAPVAAPRQPAREELDDEIPF